MKVISLITILIFLVGRPIFSQDTLSGRLVIDSPFEQMYLGDIVEARLEIEPYNLVGKIDADELEGKKLLGFFDIVWAQDSAPSPNNQDVLVSKLILVYSKAFQHTELHVMEIGDISIPISIENANPQKDDLRPKGMIFFEHPYEDEATQFYKRLALIVIGFILVLLLFWFYKNRIKKLRLNREKRMFAQKSENWIKEFGNAKTRQEIEGLIQRQKDWDEYLVVDRLKLENFINFLNEHQYKKNWSADIEKQVFEEFARIKEDLKTPL